MTYNLFIDDERFPKDVTWADYKMQEMYRDQEWKIARTCAEAYKIIRENGSPKYISFDHDLGQNQATGYDFAKDLVNEDQEETGWFKFTENFDFYVHSMNPIGKKNIESILNNYLNFKRNG